MKGKKSRTDPGTVKSNGEWVVKTQAPYDPAGRRDLTTVIVGAIAEARGVSITEIRSPPLYDVIDVAGVDNALFGRSRVAANGTESTVEFRYNEYKVRVEPDGWITVAGRSEESSATQK